MAEGYVDHGAYASNLGATPTWGVPQEGDGSATGASSAAAIASVVFGSVPSSGALSICGVSPSMTGVTGAASVDAAANALASNINATTTAVGSSVAFGTPRLQNLVFARGPAGGAPAGTCQIMMRVGSDTLNHASNVNVALTQTLSPAATLTQFVGGSGGCYGWLINDVALGASSFHAAGSYGVLVANPYVRTFTPTELDFIYARTASGKTITLPVGTSLVRGNVGWPMNMVFDTNTKWTGDSGTGVVEIRMKASGGGSVVFRPENSNAVSNQVSYNCLLKGNFRVSGSVNNANAQVRFFDGMNGGFAARGMIFTEYEAPGSGGVIELSRNSQSTVLLIDCDMSYSTNARTNLANGPRIGVNNTGGSFVWTGGNFSANLNGTPADTSPVIPLSGTPIDSTYGAEFTLENINFSSGGATKLKAFTGTAASVNDFAMWSIKGCKGLVLDSGALGLQIAANRTRSQRCNGLLFIGADAESHQRYEGRHGVADWNPDASPAYPKLGATQFGGSVYSIRLYWLSTGANSTYCPFSYTSTRLNRLADGTRTITQELCFDTTRGITGKQLGAILKYTDINGVPRVQDTWGTDPASSSASWTGIGSWSGFSARKFTFTTSYAVKQNTMISVEVYCIGVPPGSGNADVFIDPEPSIV